MNWIEQCVSDAKKLSKEKRQEFLDAIWSGVTLGEASKKAGITFDEANGIMHMNINSHSYHSLNKEAV